MINIAIIGGSQTEMRLFVEAALLQYKNQLTFHVFDTKENIDDVSLWHYYFCETEEEMARAAVKFVSEGKADILVKGIVPTRTVLKAVLHPPFSLKNQPLLSHVAVADLPQLNRKLLLTDTAMNISPDSQELIEITKNALKIAKTIGIEKPKVALLSSAETVNPKMPSSVTAKEVMDYFSNQDEAIVYGPISLDLALSKEAVEAKRFKGPVVGDADILVVPNIDAGNLLYKALVLFGQATMGGTIIGAKVPIVLTSRSDSVASKMAALELALSQVTNQPIEAG